MGPGTHDVPVLREYQLERLLGPGAEAAQRLHEARDEALGLRVEAEVLVVHAVDRLPCDPTPAQTPRHHIAQRSKLYLAAAKVVTSQHQRLELSSGFCLVGQKSVNQARSCHTSQQPRVR